jgi:lipoprotein NlpI
MKIRKAWIGATLCSLGVVFTSSQSVTATDLRAFSSLPPEKQAAYLNNEGVHALERNDFVAAIKAFERALALKPNYDYAKSNIAIAYNNYALKLGPVLAAQYFYKSLVVDSANKTTAANLAEVMATYDSPPPELVKFVQTQTHQANAAKSAKTRIAQGLAWEIISDWPHAQAEYEQALKLEPANAEAKRLLNTLSDRKADYGHRLALRKEEEASKAVADGKAKSTSAAPSK